jgi:hypothetical protein
VTSTSAAETLGLTAGSFCTTEGRVRCRAALQARGARLTGPRVAPG